MIICAYQWRQPPANGRRRLVVTASERILSDAYWVHRKHKDAQIRAGMVITETKLKGAFVIELDQFKDARGFFARAWSDRELSAAGLTASFVETNLSFNEKKRTLRGMHYQLPPYEQVKLVRCTRGS